MSIKIEKTLMIFELSEAGSTFTLTIDPDDSVAMLRHASNETQVSYPVAIITLPLLAQFMEAIGSDEDVAALVVRHAPVPVHQDTEQEPPAPEEEQL